MMPRFPIAILALVPLVSCAPEPPPFQPEATVIQLMKYIVDPAADVLWGSVGTIMSEEGIEEIFPRSEAEWLVVENACYTLMESGNLLMIGDRAKDRGRWMETARGMIDAGRQALEAAKARDPDAIFSVGGVVYQSCSDCHALYVPEIASRVIAVSESE